MDERGTEGRLAVYDDMRAVRSLACLAMGCSGWDWQASACWWRRGSPTGSPGDRPCSWPEGSEPFTETEAARRTGRFQPWPGHPVRLKDTRGNVLRVDPCPLPVERHIVEKGLPAWQQREPCEVGGPSFVAQRVPEGQPHGVDMRIAALDPERLVACARVHRPGRQRFSRIHAAGGPGGAE